MKNVFIAITVVGVLGAPFIMCVRTVIKYTPTAAAVSVPVPPLAREHEQSRETQPTCPTCEVCRTREEDFAENMSAYGEGVRSGQFGEFNAYVAFICMGKRGCFEEFEALRAKYEGAGASVGRE